MTDEQLKEYKKVIGANFKRKRADMGLSKSVLADKFGLATEDITNYEKGNISISFDTIIKLYFDIGLNVIELFDPNELFVLPTDGSFHRVVVGTLIKPYGLKGYRTAEVGHLVYVKGDRYAIDLIHEIKLEVTEIRFYKETLAPFIDFDNKGEQKDLYSIF